MEDGVDRGTEPHGAAAAVERLDREREDGVVRSLVWGCHARKTPWCPGNGEAVRRRSGARFPHASSAPRHQAKIPFWACRRFSAASKKKERGPSISPSVA